MSSAPWGSSSPFASVTTWKVSFGTYDGLSPVQTDQRTCCSKSFSLQTQSVIGNKSHHKVY
eukprot:scaffold220221_cov15-Prasinocladus_malaysianus.AAC.1